MKRESIDAALAALSEADEPQDVLEAVGRLVLLGGGDRIGPVDVAIELGIGELEEGAFEAIALLDRADPIEGLRRAFDARDAVEMRLIGAQVVLGHPPALSVDEESALIAFEEALRPLLWRFTALNEWRALEVAWIVPEHRERFWWWSEASDVDPRGALHLDAVAELVARFPEAEQKLHQLAATDLLLRNRPSSVVELGAWIRSRMPPFAMAASTARREQVLLEHRSFTLSLLPPDTLLIDLNEPCGERLPRLRLGTVELEAEPVPDALERYRFDLRSAGMSSHGELILSLASGTVRVSLPPDSST